MSLPYKLVLSDGGRNMSRRPGQTADCTVRSLAIVTGVDYDTCYDLLAKSGRKPCHGFDIDDWLRAKRGRVLGGRFKAVDIYPFYVGAHLTPGTFSDYYPKGRFLLSTERHVWVVLDSVHHDLWRVKEQPLVDAWQWHPNKEA